MGSPKLRDDRECQEMKILHQGIKIPSAGRNVAVTGDGSGVGGVTGFKVSEVVLRETKVMRQFVQYGRTNLPQEFTAAGTGPDMGPTKNLDLIHGLVWCTVLQGGHAMKDPEQLIFTGKYPFAMREPAQVGGGRFFLDINDEVLHLRVKPLRETVQNLAHESRELAQSRRWHDELRSWGLWRIHPVEDIPSRRAGTMSWPTARTKRLVQPLES